MTQTNSYSKGSFNGKTYSYVDATFFNNTTTNTPATFSFPRNDIFPFESREWELLVARFDIDSQLMSSYIPYIRTDNSMLPYGYPSPPSITNFTAEQDTLLNPEGYPIAVPAQNATSLYFEMSLVDAQTGTSYTRAAYVKWAPFNNVTFLPTSTLDRNSIINNPYYYSPYSLYIMRILQVYLTNVYAYLTGILATLHGYTDFNNTQIRIIKNPNNSYSLLMPQPLFNTSQVLNFSISFNNDLLNILPFDYSIVQSVGLYQQTKIMNQLYIDPLALIPLQLQTIYGTASYYTITTLVGSTYINPWKSLTLTTVNIPVVNQLTDNNSTNSSSGQLFTQSNKIVTDYLLITDDPDNLKQVITYEPVDYVRWINLKNSNVNTYDITPYLTTSDGYSTTISLKPNTEFSIKLVFRYTP